jgi:hypothetical protein
MIGPDPRLTSPSQKERTCQAVPNLPSRRNTAAETMAARGRPTAPGLKTECSRPVRVTSTQPASQGKNPTTTIPTPAIAKMPAARVVTKPFRSRRK